jgi:hypothetical protein
MAAKHMKIGSKLLAICEMTIKTAMTYTTLLPTSYYHNTKRKYQALVRMQSNGTLMHCG